MQYQQLTHLLLIIHNGPHDCDILHTCGIAMAFVAGQCGKEETQTFPVRLGMGL